MRYRWTILALSAAIPLAGCGGKGGGEAASEATAAGPVAVEMAMAEVRAVDVTVAAPGTLAAAQGRSARIAPVTAGKVDAVLVKEGDRVAQGQVLVALDARPARAQANGAAAAAAASDAQALEAGTAAKAAEKDQKSAVRLAALSLGAARLDRNASVQQAESAYQQAATDLKKTKAGPRTQEIAQADQAVRQAKSTRDRAATELDRVTFLNGKGIVPRRQLEDAKTALEVADSALESAKQQAAMAHEGSRPEDVRAADLRLSAAKDALIAAQASGDAKVRQAEAALTQAEEAGLQVTVKRQEAIAMKATAAQKRQDLAAAQASAAYTLLRSPISGIVTKRTVNPGDIADPATAAIEIANTHTLDLVANLPADDGSKVRPGMPAHVTSADQMVNGRVISAGQVDPQTNLMTVRIAVDNPLSRLKAGAFAVAAIVLRVDHSAIIVPKQAVVSREGKSVVYTVKDGVAHEDQVTLGPEHGDTVEILNGLKRGDTVIRVGQYELADGAKVKPAGAKEQ